MRFIQKWSYGCASFLTAQLNESHEKRGVYYFGFQVVIGAIVKGVLLVGISLLLGVLKPALIIMAAFAALRVMAGGYHMDTYGKCIATSLGMFVVVAVIARYTGDYWNMPVLASFIGLSFLAGLLVVYKWVPDDTQNRPITKPEEIKKFRRISFIYVFVYLVLVSVLLYTGAKVYVLAVGMGYLLELFTITPVGHRFFDWISGKQYIPKNHSI